MLFIITVSKEAEQESLPFEANLKLGDKSSWKEKTSIAELSLLPTNLFINPLAH